MLPKVKRVYGWCVGEGEHTLTFQGSYDADLNEVEVNHLSPMLLVLLHELGHWLICLLPRCDWVYNLNMWYDYLCNRLLP